MATEDGGVVVWLVSQAEGWWPKRRSYAAFGPFVGDPDNHLRADW